jgi:hypothetical protein
MGCSGEEVEEKAKQCQRMVNVVAVDRLIENIILLYISRNSPQLSMNARILEAP